MGLTSRKTFPIRCGLGIPLTVLALRMCLAKGEVEEEEHQKSNTSIVYSM